MTVVNTTARRLLAATVLAGLGLGAVAVGPAMAQERSIKVWFGRQDFIPEDQFAAFKADYPDIDVQFEVIRLEDVNSQLILALRSGNAPDIVQIQARDVSQLALGGVVKDFSFSTFDIVLALTAGGPLRATELVSLYMYDLAFLQLNFGEGAVEMVVLLTVNTCLSLVYLKIFVLGDYRQKAGQ